jgi:IPT/TIG domain
VSDFSRLPQEELKHAQDEHYVGIYFKQGVPILDRDLNLLQDLVATTVRSIVSRYIGDGIPPDGKGFEIRAIPADNDFVIGAGGTCLVGGIEVAVDEDVQYTRQAGGVPDITPPTGAGQRVDLVYLDVSLETVDAGDGLDNADDIGIQTSVRVRPAWTVHVAQGASKLPDPSAGHFLYLLATLTRPPNVAAVQQEMIADKRQTGINLAEVERRVSEVERLRIQLSLDEDRPFVPRNGVPNDSVRIFGNNLDVGGLVVTFGDEEAKVGSVDRDVLIVQVPPHAQPGRVPVTVTTAGGTMTTVLLFTINSAGPPPVFTSGSEFSPTFGPSRTVVTLNGKNFSGAAEVTFGDAMADLDPGQVSDTRIQVAVPDAASGSRPISVTTPAGTTLSDGNFTVGDGPAFSPNFFTPRNGPAGSTVVTISGTHLDTPPVSVSFDSTQVPINNPLSTEIKVTVPQGLAPGPHKITVTTGIGSATAGPTFNVQ